MAALFLEFVANVVAKPTRGAAPHTIRLVRAKLPFVAIAATGTTVGDAMWRTLIAGQGVFADLS
jgi:hypothetical protein